MDRQTDDQITRWPKGTFQVRGIKSFGGNIDTNVCQIKKAIMNPT